MSERPRSTSGFWENTYRPDVDQVPQPRKLGDADSLIPDLGSIEPRYVLVEELKVRMHDAVHPPTTVYPLDKPKG